MRIEKSNARCGNYWLLIIIAVIIIDNASPPPDNEDKCGVYFIFFAPEVSNEHATLELQINGSQGGGMGSILKAIKSANTYFYV